MKKFLLAGLVALMGTTPAWANESQFLRLIERQVQQEDEQHCDYYIKDIANLGNRYFVAYNGESSYDPETGSCGGNLTASYLAEFVKTGNGYRIANLNLLDYDIEVPGYIQEMAISNGKLIILSITYGRGDTQHQPRNTYRTEVRLSDMTVLRNEFEGKLPENYYNSSIEEYSEENPF